MSRRALPVDGVRYGRLVVLRDAPSKGVGRNKQRCVECRCDCGVVKEYRLHSLRNGGTRSCGCLSREVAGDTFRTHGMSTLVEYQIWKGMLRRCSVESEDCYRNYGGRGISVCARWRGDFLSFYEDMGSRPSLEHSIDRKNNDGSYSCGHCDECVANGWPANCRWATHKEQSRNMRVNYLVQHNGETKCVAEWAEQYDIKPSILYSRLVKLGWTFEKAVGWPVYVRQFRSSHPHYRVPMKERDSAWQREHERLEVKRIAEDRGRLELIGDQVAKTHRVDESKFKSLVDTALSEGWTWNGAILHALREMFAVK